MSRRFTFGLAALATLLLPLAALSITARQDQVFRIEPNATDTQPICFVGRTVTAIDSVSVEIAGAKAKADASPAAIVTAQSCTGGCGTGCEIRLVISPAAGCVSSTCRAGNFYQVRTRVTDASGNHPTHNFLVQVAREDLDPPTSRP